MSESAALAKALAAQLGNDLDLILGSESSETPVFEMAATPPMGVELRQVAGLNSGFTQSLPPGKHRFGAGSDSEAGDSRTKAFELTVTDNHQVFMTSEVNVRLDGIVSKTKTEITRQVIDAGSARFVVAQSKPPARRRGGNGARVLTTKPTAPVVQRIRISEFLGEPAPPEIKKRRFGMRTADRIPEAIQGPLIDRILAVRSDWVFHERSRFPDPGQLKQMAMAGSDHRGYLEPGDDEFAVVPVAYGDLTWQPPIDRPDRIPAQLVAEVQQHSILPSVPLFADLKHGHLGIVGNREACLAVARQVALTLRVMSPFDAITFSLLRSEGATQDWAWLDQLSAGNGMGMPIMFFDGMRQVSNHGMRQSLIEPDTGGAIIIDDQLHDIPSLCATVLEIQPSGTAALLDFRRGSTTTRVATPLGFDLATTDDISQSLRGL